jgi:hypothetical protein
MGAAFREMFAVGNGTATSTVTIDLGSPQTFIAWGDVTFVDPLNNFDRDNAVAIDIPFVDGSRTATRLSGGGHLGDPGAFSNLHQGAIIRFGRSVTFRLRAFHGDDLNAFGYGLVITNP